MTASADVDACEEEQIHPDLLELISMYREGFNVLLPRDLGIVSVQDNCNTVDAHVVAPIDAVEDTALDKEDVHDLVDLHELGGSVSWPLGWNLQRAKAFLA